jgi:hypothetical protein
MSRLGALLVVVAACGSQFPTGPADLTGINPAVMSAGAVSFSGSDGAGNIVLGWKLQFFANGSGFDCLSTSANEVADIDIYTNQTPNGGAKAMLSPSEISIVPDNPPTAQGDVGVAHMPVNGIHSVNGGVMLSAVHINSSNEIDRFVGMVNAAGTSDAGDTIDITGMFTAPVCE